MEPANTSFIANSGIPEAYGALAAGGEFASEHPFLTGAAALGAGSALSKVPGLSAIAPTVGRVGGAFVPEVVKSVASGAMDLGRSGLDYLHTNNLSAMAEQIRKGERFGQDMSQLKQVYAQKLAEYQAKMPNVSGSTSTTTATGPVAPNSSMLGRLAQGAGKMIAPAMIAKELFYTSPEEVQQLQQMRQSGTSLKDTMNKKYQEINTAIRDAAARKALGQ